VPIGPLIRKDRGSYGASHSKLKMSTETKKEKPSSQLNL